MGDKALIGFEETAFAEYRQWAKEDNKIIDKIDTLITEILRNPFHGTGKPEPLKGNLSGH
jgi:toxin YoeB